MNVQSQASYSVLGLIGNAKSTSRVWDPPKFGMCLLLVDVDDLLYLVIAAHEDS